MNKIRLKDRTEYSAIIKLTLPIILQNLLSAAVNSADVIMLNHVGQGHISAVSLASQYANVLFMVLYGLGTGVTMLSAQYYGRGDGRMEEAERSAKALVRLTVLSGLIGGVIVLAAAPFVLAFANLTETGRTYLRTMLLINSYYVMGQAVNTTMIAGIFRAGGDSRFGFICDTVDMWLYALPLGFLAAAVLKLPPLWVCFLLCTDEFVKWPWVIARYRSRKWLRNITRENAVEEGAEA